MGKKYYCIKNINNERVDLIFDNWQECKSKVEGNKAEYKSFKTLEEAKSYLSKESVCNEYSEMEEDVVYMFVDGSYDKPTNYYSYGVIVVKNNTILDLIVGKGENINGDNNISGENKATLKALEYASVNNITEFVICYDCESNYRHSYWGDWKRNKDSSKKYYESTCKYKYLKPKFLHIKGHQNKEEAFLNELVDTLCKQELGIKFSCNLNGLIDYVYVKNEDIKNALKKIIKEEKIKIISKHI